MTESNIQVISTEEYREIFGINIPNIQEDIIVTEKEVAFWSNVVKHVKKSHKKRKAIQILEDEQFFLAYLKKTLQELKEEDAQKAQS